MAETSTSSLRKCIGISLRVLNREFSALPGRELDEDAAWWGSEWVDYMSRFEWLVDLAEGGSLTDAEYGGYERLLQLVSRSLPLTQQFDLWVPGKVLEAIGRLDEGVA